MQFLQFLKNAIGRQFPRAQRFGRFIAVGASGLVVNNLVMAFCTEIAGAHYLLSAAVATQGSTLWNFSLTESWVFTGRREAGSLWSRFWRYFLMNNLSLLLRGPLLVFLTSGLGVHYLVSNLVSIFALTVLRFLFSDLWIWRGAQTTHTNTTFFYDIHGILKLQSAARLPELESFRAACVQNPDIRLAIGELPSQEERQGLIVYEEILKGAGFGVAIARGEITRVTATPLLDKSPHVLYTNVIEPILRWHFVRKGYALIHGACLSFDGSAMIITARTDTGKTSTILRALGKTPSRFLSDDMVILSPEGQLLSYPKPLTISLHTLGSVNGARFSLREKLALQIQSRLHSRAGRRFGMMLAELGLPAASLNALIQMLVPPPKYAITRLVPEVVIDTKAYLSEVVFIQNGSDGEEVLERGQAVDGLLQNAEDAYGFPPYPFLADQLSRWKGRDLHAAERDIISRALIGCSYVRLRSSSYGWWRRLPYLLDRPPIAHPQIQPDIQMEYTRMGGD